MTLFGPSLATNSPKRLQQNMLNMPPDRAANPYAVRRPFGPHNGNNMGRQSQQRISNTKRAFNLAATNSYKKRSKTGGQLKIGGGFAFDSLVDCNICVAMEKRKSDSSVNVPHKPHHVLCIKNSKTQGKGDISAHMTAVTAEEKYLKQLYNTPLAPHEKASMEHTTPAAAAKFFSARKPTTNLSLFAHDSPPPIDFCKLVGDLISSPRFQEKHKAKGTPLAMIAFAFVVRDEVMNSKVQMKKYFDGLTITVPQSPNHYNNPHYHSIIGNKLLLVDWPRMYGIEVPCVDANCAGILNNERTNFSKNQTLFPIFSLDDSPAWCMVQSMVCTKCKRRFDANDSSVLILVPPFASQEYPVDTKYALNDKASHLSRTTTEVFDNILVTYGNGELCSRLLYNTLNRAYLKKVKSYYSYLSLHGANQNVLKYIEKDGEYIKTYPPQGDSIRDMFDQAASSKDNEWGISDHDRHTRELQSVQCKGGIFAQDHTFEVVKNYPKKLGAKALWDVATDTGEIACAILVPSCHTKEFSHAARALVSRKDFTPQVMYSDTWPNKDVFWQLLVPGLIGRLGLFHFQKRILSTLRKKHVDFTDAMSQLLFALYDYCPDDYEKLLLALKEGSLSTNKKMYSDTDIEYMQETRSFQKRYGKYLRKVLRPPQTMEQKLDEWFCCFKVTSSQPHERPAGGRLDPFRGYSLFTQDTKGAVDNCKQKAKHLSDPFPIEKMYDMILPNPNNTHQLTEYLSRRGESKLESFHDRMSHFANSGMRASLADNLNLTGTARYNLTIRHKRALTVHSDPKIREPSREPASSSTRTSITLEERKKIPASWEKVVPYWNHSELQYVNELAKRIAVDIPFPHVEPLTPDTGERFFSEYLTSRRNFSQKFDENDLCLCLACIKLANGGVVPLLQSTENQNNNLPTATTTTNIITTTTTATTTNATNAVALRRPLPRQHARPAISEVGQPRPSNIPNGVGWSSAGDWNNLLLAPNIQFAPAFQVFGYPSFFPQVGFPQQYIPPIPPSCCTKYSRWLTMTSRVGRPPHDAHCGTRLLQLSKQKHHRHMNDGPAPKEKKKPESIDVAML